MDDLETPGRRDELLGHLDLLADRDWIRRSWEDGTPEERRMDDILNFFDDSHLFDDASAMIGFILLGDEEVPAIEALHEAVDTAIDGRGLDGWLAVADVAAEVRRVLLDANG